MEQRKLIKLKGETKEMTCSEVYEQFKNFIFKTAHGFLNSGDNLDDLIQVANIGLVKAFNLYKFEYENLFLTYLAIVVNSQLLMHIRKLKKRKSEMSLDDCLCIDNDGNSLTLSDVIKEPKDCEEIAIAKITNTEIKTYIGELNPRYRRILELFYFNNTPQNIIAKELNLSQAYISRLLKRALKTLKNKYERNGYFMTKKEECYKIFEAHLGATSEQVISLVIEKVGVTKTTAQTYYPAWRNNYMGKPEHKKVKELKTTKIANKNTKVTEIYPVKAIIIPEVRTPEVEGVKWKADVMKPVEATEELFEVTKLIPVIMLGKHGEYKFDKDGVKGVPNEGFISKEWMQESLEAFEIWERCYTKIGIQ